MNYLRRAAFVGLAFLIAACASGGHMMTAESFYSVPMGTSREELVEQVGKPARVVNKGGGVQEYEYVERLSAGARTLQETRYIYTIENDKITARRVERSSPNPSGFENDSYNMQTTQNGPSS